MNDWYRANNTFYRKTLSWPMKWTNVKDFGQVFVKVSHHSGPLAVFSMRYHDLHSHRHSHTSAPIEGISTLDTYTAKGTLISTTPWSYEPLLDAAWTLDGLLVCVFSTGIVRVFSCFGEVKFCYRLIKRISMEGGITHVHIDPHAGVLVVLTQQLRLYVNRSLVHNTTSVIHTLCAPCSVKSIAMKLRASSVPIQDLGLADFYIFIVTTSGAWLLVSLSEVLTLSEPDTCVVNQQVSLYHPFVVLLCQHNTVRIYACDDLPKVALAYTLQLPQDAMPLQLAFIGDHCVACHMMHPSCASSTARHVVYMGGPKIQWFPVDESQEDLVVVSHINSLRVLHRYATNVIERVTPVTKHMFQGTETPSALLVSAFKKYKEADMDYNTCLPRILPHLPTAIMECIDAAAHEMDVSVSIALLGAAAFARGYLREYVDQYSTRKDNTHITASHCDLQQHDTLSSGNQRLLTRCGNTTTAYRALCKRLSRAYISTCQDLRVTKALAELPLEMPLTVASLRQIGRGAVLCLLAHRRVHLLALRIAESWGVTRHFRLSEAYAPYDVQCSQELFEICSSFWVAAKDDEHRDGTDDVTRALGVRLALHSDTSATTSTHARKQGPVPDPSLWSASTVIKPMTQSESVDKDGRCSTRNVAKGVDFVLQHWVREKIASSPKVADDELFETIKCALAQVAHFNPKIVYFVLEAVKLSRARVGILLLQFEPRSRVQVRILLRLAEYDLALKQAVHAVDVDLIVECFAFLEASREMEDQAASRRRLRDKVLHTLSMYPVLWDFYETISLRQQKFSWLQSLYEEINDFRRAAWISLRHALSEPREHEIELFAHSAAFFGSSSHASPLEQLRIAQELTLEHLELLNLQKKWETQALQDKAWGAPPLHLLGLPLYSTIKELFVRHRQTEIETLKDLFSLSSSRLLKLQIQTLIEHDHITELEHLAQSADVVGLVGGVDFFLTALRRYNKLDTMDTLMPLLRTSASLKTTWLPKVFQTFETSDMKRVVTLLASLRDEHRPTDDPRESRPPPNTRLHKVAQSFLGSIKEVFHRDNH